tara:strand:+ start:3661 stop:4857 length:1197 start_codon:yes stop_codon:yes gene_type:complete
MYNGYDIKKKMNITVVGLGYVGASLAVLLSKYNKVTALDVIQEKVDCINDKKSPIIDNDITEYLANEDLNLFATKNKEKAYLNADYVLICTPTDYNPETEQFDTTLVKMAIEDSIAFNKNATIVVKSTVPLGFIDMVKKEKQIDNIFFSPEFLREGKALYDNLYPSRIIIGDKSDKGSNFAKLLQKAAHAENIPVLQTDNKEAEAIKLFANSYLAMRVSYFNELDTFSELNSLNTKEIIDGVSLDPRIGNQYNNPSFGYGGYCLPKDTKQLLSNFKNIPQRLIRAIVESNDIRMKFIVSRILEKEPSTVGVYRLVMKKGSDNFRESALMKILNLIKHSDIEIIVYEPSISEKYFEGCKIINDLNFFLDTSDIILANRLTSEIRMAKNKVYSRDIFNKD